jgi:type II secretory pathway pseudopilin PulG
LVADGLPIPIASGCRPSGESGDTLIELLFTIVIISLAVVALLGGLTTAIAASGEHQSLAREDALLRSYAETAKAEIQFESSSPTQFTECAQPSDYPITLSNIPSGFAVSISSIAYWNGSTFDYPSCGADDRTGVQLVTLSATGPRVKQTLNFVVRNPNYVPSE